MTKRRFRSPGGAVFVPNVDEATIALKVASGEWAPVVDAPEVPQPPKPPAKPRRRRAATDRNRD